MIDHIGATTTLSNGIEMPWLGLGVFNADDGDEVRDAVTWALDAGYRHVDTASVYRNERGIGEAIRRSAIPRDEIFVTTKVWNTDQGHERTLRALDASLERLGLAYVDLFLVHWPRPLLTEETWRAMEQTLGEGRTRAIGVSNFLVHHLEQLLASATVPPAVNQVEFHPHLQQPDLVRFCAEHDIRFEAWSPLKRGRILDHPTLTEIGRRHDATVAQVILRWDLQRGIVTTPKSVTKHRIEENARLYHFTLSDEEVAAIDALDAGDRIGPHPDVFPG
jgi:diketogulonate reductase-like aldo/keto reductase